jgi:hypothetical protein
MKINIISKEIYEIENFLSKDENDQILNLINNLTEENWNPQRRDFEKSWESKLVRIKDNAILDGISERVSGLFLSKYHMESFNKIQRFKHGQGMTPHADHNYIADLIKYGVVIYFNDDYEGGEIEYPELGIKIKPKAASLILHHSNAIHKVNIVNGNTRYFTTTFVQGNDKFPAILNPNIFK